VVAADNLTSALRWPLLVYSEAVVPTPLGA